MMQISSGRGWCLLVRSVALVILPLLTGCGPGQGTVSGKVLYQGKPVPGGTVMFSPVDSRYNLATAQLDEEGNYSLTVTAGEVRISVDNSALKDPGAGGDDIVPTGEGLAKGAPAGAIGPPKGALEQFTKDKGAPKVVREKAVGKYVKIPAEYSRTDITELRYTVKTGPQTHNIELKDPK